MYYPKSQIQTNLYSNAELTVLATGQSYTGDYWSTSNGKFFAGKTPNSSRSNIELVKTSNKAGPFPQAEPPTEVETSYIDANINSLQYARLNNIDVSKYPSVPKFILGRPTENDYKSGEFTRFFCKKINESLFIEISQNDFIKLKDKDKSLLYKLYTPFTLNWVISGIPEEVARENQNAVEYKENIENLYGLGVYLKYNYTQFMN